MNDRLPRGISYSSDDEEGYTRRRCGKSFAFYNAEKELIRCPDTRARLLRLAVPPAFEDVWYCPDPFGHLQATGRDARGRKQYRYHEVYRAYREQKKFDQMVLFGAKLPRIRRSLTHLGNRAELGEQKFILGLVVELLDATGLRIGGEAYLRENKTRGLVTLTHKNLKQPGTKGKVAHFAFVGKGGKRVSCKLAERRLTSRVRKLDDLPGRRLFRYLSPDGEYKNLSSEQVNAFIADLSGEHFTAKDFRTWAGSRAATHSICKSETEDPDQVIIKATRFAAKTLGNTPAIARKSYIHPRLLTTDSVQHFRALSLSDCSLRSCQSGLSRLETEMLDYLDPARALAV